MNKQSLFPSKLTKIIATIGPATSSPEMLEQLLLAGMNVVRINSSHGDHKAHKEVITNIRKLDRDLNTSTAILIDLQGPKLRVGEIEGGQTELVESNQLVIKVGAGEGTDKVLYTDYEQFAEDVKAGEPILLDDGKLRLEVISTDGKSEVICQVIHGGTLSSRKGLNLPQTKISLPCITKKDEKDLAFALEENVDWIGLSFVRSASDINALKSIIKKHNKHARVVAKIEREKKIRENNIY